MTLIDDFQFDPIDAWEQLPPDIVLGDVAGIAVEIKPLAVGSLFAVCASCCFCVALCASPPK